MASKQETQPGNPQERTEFGHGFVFTGNPSARFLRKNIYGTPVPDRWLSKAGDGNPVAVIPPNFLFPLSWIVYVPHLERFYPIAGEESENRAFSVAAGFIEQKV